jgi:predicted esterase
MPPHEHHLNVTRTARYYTLGDPTQKPSDVWFVLHGHMYLAKQFIRYFRVLEQPNRLVVAPEGLSRSYINHEARRVGASWMTKEDRLNEIADYVNYLDELYRHLFESINRSSTKVHVLGFSQGAATACRWVAQGKAIVDRLTIWAGLVPPDLDLTTGGETLRDAKLTIVLGDSDEYVDDVEGVAQETKLNELGILHEFIRFNGGHVLKDELLLRIAAATRLSFSEQTRLFSSHKPETRL